MEGLPPNLAERFQSLVYSEQSVAYLQIDTDFVLVSAGGHLHNYGLADLRVGEPAVEQAFFLEGLLPLAETPYLVPSVELAGGRAADLHFHLDAGTTWLLLLDVTADRNAARRVQQKAYEMTLLEEKQAQLNRRLEAANAALLITQRDLEAARDAMRDELRRKQMELNEARTLQLALAPPKYQGVLGSCALTVDVVLEPAKEVGGDLVDYFWIGSNLLVLVLGDVSGKGAAAALMMARTHALLRSIAERPDAADLFRAPEGAVQIVNRTLAQGNSSCMFITLLVATFDVPAWRLTYVRAGHLPPYLHRKGMVETLAHLGGPPPGLLEEAVYGSATVDLIAGDQLLVLTDGITEATDRMQRLFGDDQVTEFMAACDVRGQELLQKLLSRVELFEDGQPPSDDKAAILLGLNSI
jgi:serine phosphatase RsbU (regulator of sigma subunit)